MNLQTAGTIIQYVQLNTSHHCSCLLLAYCYCKIPSLMQWISLSVDDSYGIDPEGLVSVASDNIVIDVPESMLHFSG